MNNMLRTIKDVIETDIPELINRSDYQNMKAFQLVKYVTGKKTSTVNDYTLINTDKHYEYDTLTIKGHLGFIRITLTPLFQTF